MCPPAVERRLVAWRPLLAALLLSGGAFAADGTPEPAGFWTGDIHAPTPSALQGGQVVHAADLPALFKRGAVLVDASDLPHRPENLSPDSVWLPVPHKAIPNAVWIPGSGAGEISTDVDAFYRSELSRLTRRRLDAPVIAYCHEKCWLSWNAAKRAMSYGYRHVYWFPEGIEGWTAEGRPTKVVEARTAKP